MEDRERSSSWVGWIRAQYMQKFSAYLNHQFSDSRLHPYCPFLPSYSFHNTENQSITSCINLLLFCFPFLMHFICFHFSWSHWKSTWSLVRELRWPFYSGCDWETHCEMGSATPLTVFTWLQDGLEYKTTQIIRCYIWKNYEFLTIFQV